MLWSSRPARRALASHRCNSWRNGPWEASEVSLSVLVTKVPTPGGRDHAVVLELPVGLEHGVGVDRQGRHHFFHRGQLVTLASRPTEGPAHLLDDLQIGRHPRAGVQMELDHLTSIYLDT